MLRSVLAALALLVAWVPELQGQRLDLTAVEAADLFATGVRTYHNGAYQSAILAFERSLAVRPQDYLVQDWLAMANYRAGYVDAAVRRWRDLLKTTYDTAAVRSRLQYATYRHGLGAEVTGDTPWVLAYEIRSRRGELDAFRRPVSVRSRRDGSLTVVSMAGNQLAIVDVNGTVVDTLRGGIYGFDRPFDVLELEDGFLVSEFGARRIVRCSSTGQRISFFGGDSPRLLGPQFLASDNRGYVYVTDAGSDRVHKYDSEGAYILSFPGSLQGPTGIAVSGDLVYVAEKRAQRISVFDGSGNLVRTLGEGQLQAPEGIAFWDERILVVADTRRLMAGVLETDAWGEWGNLGSSRRITSVAVDPGGAVYATDMDAEVVYVLTRQANLVLGNNVWIQRISSDEYPKVTMEVSVTDRFGRPVTGLRPSNFLVYEANAAVQATELVRTPVGRAALDSVIVVDQSIGIAAYTAALRSTLLALYDELSPAGEVAVVAGEVPTVVAPPGTTRLRAAEAATRSGASARWRLDAALRVAANELGPSWGKKAVVYLTAGGVGRASFEATSLAESAAALVNTNVSLTVVSLAAEPLPQELAYLAGSTGGRIISSSDPRGVTGLARELSNELTPLYLLSYTSSTFPDFGRRYLPVRVEVVLPGPSGGDTSGYFSPVER